MRAGYVDKKGKLNYFKKGITTSSPFYQGYAIRFLSMRLLHNNFRTNIKTILKSSSFESLSFTAI